MLCDSPSNYMQEAECTDWIASIPTVWDETRVLQGEVGEYIVTARRKGDVWYVGGITNWTERDITVDLSALGLRQAQGTLYADGANAHRKGSDYTESGLKGLTQLHVHLAPGGGFVAKIGK